MKLMRGFWCECQTSTGPNSPTFAASFDAYSPHQAVRWVRVALRIVASALDDEAADQARHWLLHGYADATQQLAQGQPFTLALQHRSKTIEWRACPVLYLPMAHRQGAQLPACAERFPESQLPGRQD